MGKIISICSQKGGVGKTTTCVNLSAALGILENKVLVIDTDPQANASVSFGFSSKKLNNPALQFMDFVAVIKNNTIKTSTPNVDLLPFFEDLNFFKRTSETSKFKKSLETISSLYDFIIIDCVPFFKEKNLEILMSSNSIIIPIQCDYYSLRGLHKFLKTIRFVQKKLNPHLVIEGFLLTMFDKRLNLSKKVVSYILRYFNELTFDTIIHRNSKITQAPSFGKSVLEYDINSTGAKHYLQLANEILTKNTVTNKAIETVIIPEQKESIFNTKKISKASTSEVENNLLLEKISKNTNKKKQKNKKPSFPKNFDTLLNLSKPYIEKTMGPCYKNHFGNIWIYKINTSNIFKKRYLHIYFKNNTVSHYTTKWFS